MRYLLPALLLPVALGACRTGYASDWFRDRPSIINPQLIRYGFDVEQSRCISQQLGTRLSRIDLRSFQERAAAVRPAATVVLSPVNLRAVAGTSVAPKLDEAILACNATAVTVAAGPAVPAGAGEPAGTTGAEPATTTSGGVPVDTTPITPGTSGTTGTTAGLRTTWLNLGAADSGQSIAIDAMSIEQVGTARTAWFRMTDPETNASTNNLYRLRIDCEARTVQPLALRQVDATGAQVSLREYTPAEATPGPAESGTVREIAFLSLCT
jgi:hypothetical protein